MAKKSEPLSYDDLNERIENARALADALLNQDPAVEIGSETLFGVTRLLVKEIDAVQKMWEQHYDATRR